MSAVVAQQASSPATETRSPFLSIPPAPESLRFDSQLPPFDAKDTAGRRWRLAAQVLLRTVGLPPFALLVPTLAVGLLALAPVSRAGAAFLQAPDSDNDHDLGLFQVGPDAKPSGAGKDTVGLYHLAWSVTTLAFIVPLLCVVCRGA